MSQTPIGVGVIGAGVMGAHHVSALTQSVPEANVVVVHDAEPERARQVAEICGAISEGSAEALIADERVEAVLVAAPDPTHARLILACLEAGKPVFCEKPLATDIAEARRVIDAEVAGGRMLVQVGFMRRYDPGFMELKATLLGGSLGAPRVVHCIHRNPLPQPGITAAGIVRNSMIHELDMLRWILDDEITSIALQAGTQDPLAPQLASIRIGDVLASVEVSVNARYGYDVRCEVVGECGTAAIIAPAALRTQIAGAEGTSIDAGFIGRFGPAYVTQLRDWVHGVHTKTVPGPNAWDGFMAEVAAGSAVAALDSGLTQTVGSPARPELYA